MVKKVVKNELAGTLDKAEGVGYSISNFKQSHEM